tara:strand:+ start:5468 stop:5725 length:258 start_codon:yes stop_codon:yes gene_type:complete
MFRTLLLLILLSVVMSGPKAMALDNKNVAVTKEQATMLAQQRYPGKVLKVQTESQHYRVRLLQSDGRVVTVLVNIRTGQVKRDDK